MLPPEPRVLTPERFSGDRSKFCAFRNACELYFTLQPRTFSLEVTNMGFIISYHYFIISLLQGEPQTWAHQLLEKNESFFVQLYDDPPRETSAEVALHSLQQGCRAVEDYVTEFRRWSADTCWNDTATRLGLAEPLKDELARVGVPSSLEELINLSIQIDR